MNRADYIPTAEALKPGTWLTTYDGELVSVRETAKRYYLTLRYDDGSEAEHPVHIDKLQLVVMVGRVFVCQWFALCDRPADGTVAHPVLGDTPTCARCADKLDLTLQVAS